MEEDGGMKMLKKLLMKIGSRLLPSIQTKGDVTGHCHEAAFDPESFPETLQQQLRKNQSLSTKTDSDTIE
jgi:hypothetical protein